ncbi:YadA-like family protein [Vreelandella venusta]
MNNVFRLIWNRSLGRLVVASEAARSRGKSGAECLQSAPLVGDPCFSTIYLRPMALAIGLAVGGVLTPVAVAQTTNFNNVEVNNNLIVSGDSILSALQVTGNTTIDGTLTVSGVDISGLNARVGVNETDIADLDTRVGDSEQDIAGLDTRVGVNEADIATNQNSIDGLNDSLFTVGSGIKYFRANSIDPDAEATGTNAVAIGPSSVAQGGSSFAAGDGATTMSFGEGAIALGQNATAGTENAVTPDGEGSISLGRNSQASGNSTVALGDGAEVESEYVSSALALGANARVRGLQSDNATAVGANSQAAAANAIALGSSSEALSSGGIAIGQAISDAANALAAGSGAYSGTPDGIALGTGAGVGTSGNAAEDRTSHIAMGTQAGQDVAGNQTTAIGFGAGSGVSGDQNIALGSQSGVDITGDYNIAIGYQANYKAGEKNRATAIGGGSYADSDALALGYGTTAQGVGAIAIGSNAQADGDSLALGRNASADEGSIALGFSSVATSTDAQGAGYLTGSSAAGRTVLSVGNTSTSLQRRLVNVADGAQGHDAVNVRQLQAAQQSVASLVGGSVTLEPGGSYGGYIIELNDTNGDSHQYTSVAEAINAVSSGAISVLPGDAVIYNPNGTVTVAEGVLSDDAVNVSQLEQAVAENGVRYFSINSSDLANRDNAGAVGTNAMAIGPQADARGNFSLATGYRARAVKDDSVAVGYDVSAEGKGATVIGNRSNAYGQGGIAIGERTSSKGDNSIVMGAGAQADPKTPVDTVNNAIVIGTNAESTADDGVAVGRSALASGERAVAQGFDAHATAADALAEGTRARASGVRSHASGTDARASGMDGIASGTDARSYAANGIAIGTGAISGIANPLPGQEVNNAIAIGNSAVADDLNAQALGFEAKARAESSLAFGVRAEALKDNALAMGTGARVTAQNASAIGHDTEAAYAHSVALGDGARTTAPVGTTGSIIDRVDYTYAGTDPVATVSVGAPDEKRTITNVAAGRVSSTSTDAINGSQLFQTNEAVTSLGNNLDTAGQSVADALGGSSTYSPDTHSVAASLSVRGNTYNSVESAVQYAAQGWNVSANSEAAQNVSPGGSVDFGNTDGNIGINRSGTDLKFNLADDLKIGSSVTVGDTFIDGDSVTTNNMTVSEKLTVAGESQLGDNFVVNNDGNVTYTGDITEGDHITNKTYVDGLGDDLVAEGLNFAGNDGAVIHKGLGEQLNIVGGMTDLTAEAASAENLRTVQNADGDLEVQLSKNLTNLESVDSTTVNVTEELTVANNTTINEGGITTNNVDITENLTVAGETQLGDNFVVNNDGNVTYTGDITEGDHITNKTYVDGLGDDLVAEGLNFAGNDGAVIHKGLGEQLNIVGGMTDLTAEAASAENLRTVQNADGDLEVQLSKNLTNLESVDSTTVNVTEELTVANNTTINEGGITTNNVDITENLTVAGETQLGDNFVVNNDGNVTYTGDITEGDHITNKTYVDGLGDDLVAEGLNFAGNDGAVIHKDLGEQLNIVGGMTDLTADAASAENLRTVQNADGDLEVQLSKNLTNLESVDSTTVNVTEELTVANNTTINEGGITTNNVDITENLTVAGETQLGDNFFVTNEGNVTYDGDITEGDHITNKTYVDGLGDDLVAEGLNFAGNDGAVIHKDLGEQLNIVGGMTDLTADAASAENLRTVQNADGDLEVQLSKNLTNLESVDSTTVNVTEELTVANNTTINEGGITTNNVDITENLTVAGETQLGDNFFVTNEGNVTYDGDITEGNHITNKQYVDNSVTELGDTPLTFGANEGEDTERRLGDRLDIVGEADDEGHSNIITKVTNEETLELALNADLNVDNSITVGETFIDGDSITTNNMTVNENLTVEGDTHLGDHFSIVNNEAHYGGPITEGDHITNKSYVDNSVTELGDTPLTFGADDGEDTERRLGDRLDIVGEADDEGHSNVITKVTDEETLELALNADLNVDNSITVGETFIDGDSVTTNNMTVNESLTVEGITQLGDNFLVNNEGNVTYDGDITENNHITNKSYVDNSVTKLGDTPLTFGANEGEDTERRLGDRLDIVGEVGDDGHSNIITKLSDDETLELALNDDLQVGNSIAVGESGPVISVEGIDMSDTKITNLAEGDVSANSKDAVNGSQLYQLENIVTNVTGDISNEYITENGLGIRYVRTNDSGLPVSDAFAQGEGATAVGYEAVASADRALAMGYDAIASHQGSVALGEGARTAEAVGTASVDIAGQTYQFAGASPVATVSVGSVGSERTITNVAAGRITADSTDAINGSQLYAAMDFMGSLDDRLTIVEGDTGGGGTDGVVKYDRDDNGDINYDSVTLEGKDGTKLTNVADGDISNDSSDAINGSQLHDTNQNVANNTTNIADNSQRITNNEGNIADNSQRITTNENSITDINETLGLGLNFGADEGDTVNRQLGDTVAITGDDNITTKTTDDGVQITMNRDLDVDSVTTGNTTVNNEGVSIKDGPSMTVNGIDAGGTTITNVAPGVNESDAVNVGQMNELGRRFQNEIVNVHGRIDSVERNANAGSASAIAASTVPQAWMPGKSMIGVGAGTYGGESAVSVGISRLSDNGRWVIQGKVTGDSQSNFGAGIGAGWHW